MYIKNFRYLKRKINRNNEYGFSITDVMIMTAIIAIVATLATPNLKKLIQGYKLRVASNDLIAYVQKAKIRAAKNNETWSINFNPNGYTGYEIKNGTGDIIASINFGLCKENSTIFDRCYNGDIQYKYPLPDYAAYDNETINFQPTGITSEGYISISNKPDTKYYRVSILSTSGIVRTEKWNGVKWE